MKPNVWEIVRAEDGTFAISRKGELLRSSIPDRWLEAELGKYGFCGKEYDDIRGQLECSGKAQIVL